MKSYKGWTAKERRASLKKTKKAIRDGEIPPAEEVGCEVCGQTEGIIDYHNTDYSHPTKYLKALCFRCHIIYHSYHRDKEAVAKYFKEVENGKQYPPVYSRDMSIFAREHGIH